jgi:Penicillin-binding protein-related factor A, putative recombinase
MPSESTIIKSRKGGIFILKNCGKIFEEDIANSFRSNKGLFVCRLNDNSGAWQGNEKSDNSNEKVRFTPKNICDFIIYSNKSNKLLLLELKSFKGKSCPFTNLKEHQIKSLYNGGQKEGTEAYFILNFRDINETYAIRVELIYDFYYKSEKRSFSYEWCKINGLRIKGISRRTRWKYEVEELFKGVSRDYGINV